MNLRVPLTGANKSAKKNTTFERRAKRALKSALLSLKQSERSFPFYIPLTGAHKSAKKNTTFERWAKPALKSALLSLLSEVREVPLSKYPLLVHSKVPKKTTTFERWVKRALKSAPLFLKRRESNFPFYIPLMPYWCKQKKTRFWEASGAGSYKWLWPFIYLLHFSNQFETLHSFAKIFIIL